MKLKKTAVALMLGAFALTSVAPAAFELPMTSVAMAARGGARVSAPKAAPAPKTTAPSTQTKPNQKEYAPSKDAKSLSSSAPAANSKTNAAAATTKSSTPWGGLMRGIGLFAGGMLLGGLLSSMFGFGASGMMSEVLGLLMNIVLLGAVFMVLRMLWNKFRNRSRREDTNVYQSRYQSAAREQDDARRMVDVTPQRHEEKIVDIQPPQSGDYDPKRTADRYRSK